MIKLCLPFTPEILAGIVFHDCQPPVFPREKSPIFGPVIESRWNSTLPLIPFVAPEATRENT